MEAMSTVRLVQECHRAILLREERPVLHIVAQIEIGKRRAVNFRFPTPKSPSTLISGMKRSVFRMFLDSVYETKKYSKIAKTVVRLSGSGYRAPSVCVELTS
jgi:hypothetical protein